MDAKSNCDFAALNQGAASSELDEREPSTKSSFGHPEEQVIQGFDRQQPMRGGVL